MSINVLKPFSPSSGPAPKERRKELVTPKELNQTLAMEKVLLKAHDNIKQKCYTTTNRHYRDYGGRGITMHSPWKQDRRLFVKEVLREIGPRPTDKRSLDRIDNNGNYEPGNLRWGTGKQQAGNRRSSRIIEGEGPPVPRSSAAHAAGLKPNTLAKKVDRRSLEDPRVRNFEANWNLRRNQKYKSYPILFSDAEKRELYKTIIRLPTTEVDLLLVANAAIRFWPEFVEAAEEENGLWDEFTPLKPKLGFFLKNIVSAVDFWLRKREERDRAKELAAQRRGHDDGFCGDVDPEEQDVEEDCD